MDINGFIALISLLISLAALTFSWITFHVNSKRKRMNDVIEQFRVLHINDGNKLQWLIPSGIANLRNDKEISQVLSTINNILQYHPLRQWNDQVKKIGYKNFFDDFVKNGQVLNKTTIQEYLNASR